jgi:hypothetical protein
LKLVASLRRTLLTLPHKSSGQTPQERIEMKAPITPAQAWAVIAESARWNEKELPVLPEPAVTNDDLKEMESKVDYWREKHADLGLKYDNLLQSFHIAETDAKLWKGTAEKARGDALEEAANHITPLEKMRRIDGRTYVIAKVLADAIRALKGK